MSKQSPNSVARWLNWTPPPPERISEDSVEIEPTKPTKLGFVGFVGSRSVESQKIWPAPDSWEWIEERAALLEFDGGVSGDEANRRAFEMWFRRYVGSVRH